jgi:GNAT superfamily N-acetyltransferase
MKIVEYKDVDPLKVMFVNQLALDFALSPERVANIRQTDPRPFPCLAVYAAEGDEVIGQVGVFRLPMISIEGREDVGGLWAVSTHPHFSGRGIASSLIKEAHTRMVAAGLRFSTLGTDRFRTAHKLYRQHGYVETNVWATALARWETAHRPTRLRAQKPGEAEGYDFVEQLYQDIARDYLGFAWRHTPFGRLRLVSLADIWILYKNTHPVGYAFAHLDGSTLSIHNLTLQMDIDAAEAVAAVAAEVKSAYVQVKLSRPVEVSSLRRAGYQVANPTWNSFMIKPLVPEVSVEDAWRLFGIGTDRFMISWLDVT